MQHYLFKIKNGSTLYFYYEKPNKLVLKKLLNTGVWSKSVVLLSDITKSFAIEADPHDHFHMIYQNKAGSIYYAIYDGDTLKSYEMLKSRTNEVYDRYFQIVPVKNGIHFFYILQKDNLFSLIHHSLQHSEFLLPKVVGNIVNHQGIHYCVMADTNRSLHTFFIQPEETHGISYKKFIFEKQMWVDAAPVVYEGDFVYPFTGCISKSDQLTLCYQSILADGSCNLFLKVLHPGESVFREVKLLQVPKPYHHIEIASLMDNLILCGWEQQHVYIHAIEKYRILWETPKKIPLSGCEVGRFTSTYPYEDFHIGMTPFYHSKGLFVPILEKINLELFYKKKMDGELSFLKNRVNNLEKILFEKSQELEKLMIKVKFLENRR